jgi:L-lactate dehydrogenase complex protein LldF
MCKQICPAGIDHPSLLLSYRARQIDIKKQKGKKTMQSRGENAIARLISLGMSHGWLWNFGLKITRPLMNSLAKDGYIGSIPMGAQGWFGCRDLRAIPAKTFHETWNDLPSLPELSGNTSKKEDS